MEITIQDWNHSVIGDTTFHLPDSSAACEGTLQSALVGHSVVTEKEVVSVVVFPRQTSYGIIDI